MIAGRYRFDLARRRVNSLQVGATVFGDVGVEVSSVFAPNHAFRRPAARRALVAADAAADVEVVIGGQVPGRRFGHVVDHEEVGLRVGLNRFARRRAAERNALAVVTEAVVAHPAVKTDDFLLVAPVGRYRIKVGARRLVIRLQRAVGNEIDALAVGRPTDGALVEIALRYPLRLRRFAWSSGRRHGPDVRLDFRIEVAGAVRAIGAAHDHANVTHMLGLAFGLFFINLAALGHRIIFFAQIFRTRESDGLAVRRPLRRAGAARQFGQRLRLAAFEGEQVNLRGLRTAFLFSRADEGQPLAVGRPSRRRVSRPGGQLPRRAAVRRYDPQRRIVAVGLLIDPYADEGDARSVRRNLRVGDPRELEQVRLSNQPLLRARRGAGRSGGGDRRDDQNRREAQTAIDVIHHNAPAENPWDNHQ